MKKAVFCVASALLFTALNSTEALPDSTRITLSAGQRVDNLNWNISGNTNGTNPNILSELKWKDLKIFELKGKAAIITRSRLYLRGSFAYGWIYRGSNQDSDYNGDNRTLEFSRTENKSDSGTVWDVTGGAGYAMNLALAAGNLDIMPVAGYSARKQNLRITDGVQTISLTGTPPLGPFSGLDSTYQAFWHGPWLGADLAYNIDRLTLFGSFEYHFAFYYAQADWNLRSDFNHPKSFEHTADGSGVVASAGANYSFTDSWSMDAAFDYQKWQATDGIDRTFFNNGTSSDTRLNEVNWDSYAMLLGVKYSFK